MHEELLQNVRHAIGESENRNPDSHDAENRFADKVIKYPQVVELRYRRVCRILDILGAEDGVVLDIGAGKCLNAVLMVMAGARQVYAVEMGCARLRSAKLMIDYLGRYTSIDFQGRVHLAEGDVLGLEFQGEQFDAAYSTELLEHIADPLQLHHRLFSWLRPGGQVYDRTGANGANPMKARWYYADYWDRVDTTVLAPIRGQIIRSLAENLSSEESERLVEGTRGLTEQEIAQVVRLWSQGGAITTWPHRRRRVPRHPISAEYYERPVHPKQTLLELRAAGFTAQLVRPDFSNIFVTGKLKLHVCKAIGSLISITHPMSLIVAPWIEMLGIKPN